jgi:hypothetical protein
VSPKRPASESFDATYQHINERDPNVVDVVDADHEEDGEVTTECVPIPDGGVQEPETDGQTTWDDWRWSA